MSSKPLRELESAGPEYAGPSKRVRNTWWRRHPRLAWCGAIALMLLLATTVALYLAALRFEPFLRARIVAGLEERFHTRVELGYFHVSVHHGQEATWGLWATGRGLRVWPPHREGGDRPLETAVQSKPLIDVAEFSFHVPLRYESNKPIHIPQVRIKGLTIRIPPASERDSNTGFQSAMESPPARREDSKQAGTLSDVIVDNVLCEGTELVLESSKPEKLPETFEITRLKLNHLRAGQPMQFEAELLNPEPRGVVQAVGSFGPWMGGNLADSPLSGTYHFHDADMAAFRGLAGSLNSDGSFTGTLRDIAVTGNAEVKDFRLTHFGNALPLRTRFRAHVDGTNGDTHLEAVDATLGTSHFTTHGEIVRVASRGDDEKHDSGKPAAGKRDTSSGKESVGQENPKSRGHRIALEVNIDRGNMSDLLRLVSKSSQPLLTGDVTAQANLLIPPGEEPVHLRMKLDGHFALDDARFTSEKIQNKIEDLSLRGQGRPDDVKTTDAKSIRSSMEGSFQMARGVITLPNLNYSVPGAQIQLAGTYALDGPLHFDGTARMKATVSQMVGGWKGYLLKPFDKVFKKDGAGALVPIRVRGTRQDPDFGVDLGRVGHTAPERPGGH